MVEVAIDKTVLRVRRGGPGDAPRFDEFEVPFENGMSVLDALAKAPADSRSGYRCCAG
ncbi:MAG: 2Fe-2S iron-sulfur cluster binding domain [Deltaproteobacteria bacterium]|nr:2Fe-2S iron-sulfur cluster binding domain [Deltaproteobacteria bacterium]